MRVVTVVLGMPLCLVAVNPATAARPFDAPDYMTDWGDPPDTVRSWDQYLAWLRDLPRPTLKPPKPELAMVLSRGLHLPAVADLRVAILGNARITGVGVPKFYIWYDARAPKGDVLAEGGATISFEGENERELHLYSHQPKEELLADPALVHRRFARDAAVMVEKFLK